MHRVGLEPVTLTGSDTKDLRTAENQGGAESGAVFRQTVQNHPDLARLAEAWPTFPERLRDAIGAMTGGTDRAANLRRVVAMLGRVSDAYIEGLAERLEARLTGTAETTEPPLRLVTDGDEGDGEAAFEED